MMKWFELRTMAALLILCAVAAQGQDFGTGRKDSSRATVELSLTELGRDSLSHSEVGLYLLYVTPTDDTDPGFGGALFFDYIKFKPLVLRGGLQIFRSEINASGLVDADFLSIGFDGSLLFSPGTGKVQPYAGGGLTVYYNTWPSDRAPRTWIGPYDDYTPSSYDYGSSLAAHVRAGGKLSISRRVALAMDLKYTYSRPTADVTLRYDLTGDEQIQRVRYDQRVLAILFGVSLGL
jgi:hypothetical protein